MCGPLLRRFLGRHLMLCLGLGIVRDIVEAWGGKLQLGTAEIGGLLVSIKLPARKQKATTA